MHRGEAEKSWPHVTAAGAEENARAGGGTTVVVVVVVDECRKFKRSVVADRVARYQFH